LNVGEAFALISGNQSPRLPAKSALARTLLIAILACAPACNRGPRIAIISPDGSQRASVSVEIAADESSREIGLMYRAHLGNDAGMIFVFPNSSHVDFWMKNTPIPLDIVFAGSNTHVIGIVENARPYSESMLGVPGASQYVLEVNAGFCAAHGVKAGDRLDFSREIPRAGN
jgi:hypothetical protein